MVSRIFNWATGVLVIFYIFFVSCDNFSVFRCHLDNKDFVSHSNDDEKKKLDSFSKVDQNSVEIKCLEADYDFLIKLHWDLREENSILKKYFFSNSQALRIKNNKNYILLVS